ncbi:hypothetical protein O6H91_10G073800 [Diphasiastrum complanatum]|uniref:Uncharacterized protein n=1 Tax=Diphasiastrum complanatum TaxID=34168 RepID=A0ACC2CIH5_DIPCM|nr:hypothetical protein O6H91_10G073800 [Diphasiastrum complanatum]
MSLMRGDLMTKTMKAVKSKIIDKPAWFDAVLSVPPQMVRPRGIRAKKIKLPEDPYVESYYARHPDADCIPFELNSFDPPPARKFAWRQMEIMKKMKTKNRKLARDIVEVKLHGHHKLNRTSLS